MRVVIVSDTHGRHRALGRLSGDVLIHCGDVDNLFQRYPTPVEAVDRWFGEQDFAHILCVGGNHDVEVETRVMARLAPFQNATFLHEAGVEIEGLRFYGVSWVPDLMGHAFFADDEMLERAWDRIPDDVDVLITHTPPGGILDVSSRGRPLGCPLLARRLRQIQPQLHCFGHVHASAGQRRIGETTYVNATSVNSELVVSRPPVVIDLPTGARP